MLETLLIQPAPSLTLLAVVLLTSCLYFFSLRFELEAQLKADVPEIVNLGLGDNRETLQNGYEKYAKSHQPYYFATPHHGYTILPIELVKEIKSLPEDNISFQGEIHTRFFGQYTGLNVKDSFVGAVNNDLTKNIARIISELTEECQYALSRGFGDSEEWTSSPIYEKVVRIVALVTGRVFIGLPHSRDEAWLQIIVFHTRQIFVAANALYETPRWSRNVIGPFLPAVRKLRSNLDTVKRLIRSRVIERVELLRGLDAHTERPNDMVQWLMNSAPPRKEADVGYHAKQQLDLSVASIHTTGTNITQNLYDLAAYPEYQSLLREEILDVLRGEPASPSSSSSSTLPSFSSSTPSPSISNATITKQTLTRLRKLDSFMKESQRLSPPSILGTMRQITSPTGITLSTGLHLPGGTFVASPSYQVAMDEDVWRDPHVFDGMRSYRLRTGVDPLYPNDDGATPSEPRRSFPSQRHQFVTTSDDNLVWGQGTHACPGRFFAANEIKIVLANVILNYDLRIPESRVWTLRRTGDVSRTADDPRAGREDRQSKQKQKQKQKQRPTRTEEDANPEDERRGRGRGRPPNTFRGIGVFIDTTAEIEYRRRKTGGVWLVGRDQN